MDAQRMKALADAYGGDPRRWPAAEALAAQAWAADRPDEAARLLFDARQTDAALDASARPMVSQALRDRVLAQAMAADRAPRGFNLFGRARGPVTRGAWLSGFGWAAAACAGVVVGHVAASQMTADIQADAVLYQASMTAIDETEMLG